MGCIRPATPGFILTALATALLAVVSFCVPFFKSVFFLKASITVDDVPGTVTFGTLGYCLELAGITTCSKPSVGYEFDINNLLGNNSRIQVPAVVVKWVTYVLVLHIVALILAAGAAVFGLLAHVREMAMTCCSSCISGFAAAVALVAFIFDIALFFIAKARIKSVGTATIGNAIWLTLAAWVLLLFSGCFYTLGRCCLSNRKSDRDRRKDPPPPEFVASEQTRLDAVKAEADRKARQQASDEGGLPAFYETVPLRSTAYDDGANIYPGRPQTSGRQASGGYMQAPPGTRAVDQFYNDNADPSAEYNAIPAYPPSQHRTPSAYEHRTPSAYENRTPSAYENRTPSVYAPSTYTPQPQQFHATPPLPPQQYNQYHATPPPPNPMSPPPQQPYRPPQQALSPPQQYAALDAVHPPSPVQRPNTYLDPAAANMNMYGGHTGYASRGTSYHSAVTHPGEYSQYDPYDGTEYLPAQTAYAQQSQNNSPHGHSPYITQSPQEEHAQADEYGNGYGTNSVPSLDTTSGYFTQPVPGPSGPSSPKGPRKHRQSLYAMNAVEEDSPPGYDQGSSAYIPGAWGKN